MSVPNGSGQETNGTPTVAVTGAAGYIGSRVLVELQDNHPEWDLIALDNYYCAQVGSVGDVDIQHVDIRDRRRLESTLDGSDVVLHLAAVSGVDECEANPDLAYEVNITGTNNVAWFCRQTGAALVFPFSMAVLGDPETLPITSDLPRNPLNWYGRTKYLGERVVETLADGSFPAHLLLKSNLYGQHEVDGTVVSKPMVIDFFVERAKSGEPLPVYEPGTQSRNFVHVEDIGRAYVRSTERLIDALETGVTGATTYEVGGHEDPSVMEIAETVARRAREELGRDLEVTLVENPREGETLVEEFTVDTSDIRADLGWHPTHTVDESVRRRLTRDV